MLEAYPPMNHFEILGLTPRATDAEVQKAYMERARQYHPDRVRGDVGDLRDRVADLFARITHAHKVLKNPKTREEYLRTVGLGGDDGGHSEEEVVQQIIDADTTFQKARVFGKMGRLDEAERLARAAAAADPEQGDYAALLAWIESRKLPKGADTSPLIDRLKAAVKLAPMSEDAHFYLAQLLYAAGRNKEALHEYAEVMDINTHNVDAVRMVRHLRRQLAAGAGKKKEPKGLLGVLLKDIGGKK